MQFLRIILFLLILWNLPSKALFLIGPEIGSLLSHLTILLLCVYFFLDKKTCPNWWLICISLSYFIISGFQYNGVEKFFIFDSLKYLLLILGGYQLVKNIELTELFIYLLLASMSIALEAIFFTTNFGRYSGLYLNPNEAGFICIIGFALSFKLKNTSISFFGQFIFTLMGLLTFSRTFLIIWLIINLLSIMINFKNIRIIGIGILIFSTLLLIDEYVGLNNPRFEQLQNVVLKKNISINEVSEDSRMETWSKFYDRITGKPFIGSGYGTFSGKKGDLGVHNSFLMIIGEAGIIPFLLFISYFIYLFYWSIRLTKINPYLVLQTTALTLFLFTDHNFFVNYFITLIVMFIQYQIEKDKLLLHSNTI